ncbi:unnamed protein product [Protopolystoma xenopodis]|uniref:Uncharacterized protein n=1 Tax=Protopolystoma xenopodis TaxID=117903 RepID=A0A448WKH0_9PLAT|nr:unnamed protein product [Protopolystoma xenopodis]
MLLVFHEDLNGLVPNLKETGRHLCDCGTFFLSACRVTALLHALSSHQQIQCSTDGALCFCVKRFSGAAVANTHRWAPERPDCRLGKPEDGLEWSQ